MRLGVEQSLKTGFGLQASLGAFSETVTIAAGPVK